MGLHVCWKWDMCLHFLGNDFKKYFSENFQKFIYFELFKGTFHEICQFSGFFLVASV